MLCYKSKGDKGFHSGGQPGPETPWTYPNWLSLSSSLILGSLDMSIFTGLLD